LTIYTVGSIIILATRNVVMTLAYNTNTGIYELLCLYNPDVPKMQTTIYSTTITYSTRKKPIKTLTV